jgi:hypothetical protein
MGNDSVASAAGSHPRHRLFGQATPGPAPTLRPPAAARGSKTRHPVRGRCHEPLDAKRHRYVCQWLFHALQLRSCRTGRSVRSYSPSWR